MRTLLLKAAVVATPAVLVFAAPAAAQRRASNVIPAVKPDSRATPGGAEAVSLLGGFQFWALIACSAGFLYGLVRLAIGKFGTNHHHAGEGGKAVGVALVAAALVTATPVFINWAAGIGSSVTP